MLEKAIQQSILKEFGSRKDLKIWRNNVGFAYGMNMVRSYVPEHIQPTKYGVQGSADIFGILAPNGRHVSIEVKGANGRQTPEQVRWQEMVESMGGIYILARNTKDVLDIIN